MDTFISWAALLFSGIALIVSIRTQLQQRLLMAKQIAAHDREVRERLRALVTASLSISGSVAGRHSTVTIVNAGPSEARQVDLAFQAGTSPLPEGERGDKLPIPVLQPYGSIELMAAISNDCHPPFHAVLTWRDGLGQHQQELTLS